jgi:FH1/FH2 domain-containing protein 3
VSSRYGSTKDLSSETKTRLASTFGTAKKEEKGPPITFNTRYKVTSTRGRSRDPSPAAGPENPAPQTALQRISAARSRDPSPTTAYARISAARSRDPSPVSKTYTDSTATKPLTRTYSNSLEVGKEKTNDTAKKTYGVPLTSVRDKLERTYSSSLATNREKSRDPSPSVSRRPSITSITSNYSRSRDPSPESSYLLSSYRITNGREKSRDPSPTISLNKTKLRESSPLSITPYRRPSREPSPSESLSKYSTPSSYTSPATALNRLSASNLTQQSKTPDISISYMSASEANSRPSRPSRVSYINRHSPQKENSLQTSLPAKSESPIPPPREPPKVESESDETTSSSSEETDDSSEEEIVKPEPKIMIQVTTITRGTSPNPPGSSSSLRVRRIEYAKTIEKVRQRPLQAPPMIDKSTQSDRMDDSTRTSRYGITSRTPYSPYSPSPTSYSSRYTPRYNRETTETVETDKSDSDRMSQKSDKFNFSLPKSKETSPVKSDTSRSSSIATSPSPSRISVAKDRARLSSSKTPESVRPPQSPTKSESPKIAAVKGSNKDFRKSALNMGPTDRVRRSKSSSSDNSSPTVEKTVEQFQNLLNGGDEKRNQPQQVERSISVESDSSTESIEMQSQIEQKKSEPTKEEIISHKVEEAKSYLLKTLGNPAALNSLKSPVTVESESEYPESISTNFTTQTNKLDLDFSGLQKAVSGEKPWWMDDSDKEKSKTPENDVTVTETLPDDSTKLLNGFSDLTINSTQGQNETNKYSWMNGPELSLSERFQKLERVQSGEKAWWCESPENKVTSDNQAVAQNVENAHMWEQETQADISEIQQDDEIREIDRNYRQSVSATPLGDRASPEGLEANFVDRKSPYDNLQGTYGGEKLQDFNARPRLFISRHTNIDDLLGKFVIFLWFNDSFMTCNKHPQVARQFSVNRISISS